MALSSYTSLPPAADGFEWTIEPWGPALRCRALEAIAPHVFTTRHVDLSTPAHVRSLAPAVDATDLVMATQVHGRDTLVVRDGEQLSTGAEADVLVSNAPDIAVAVRIADCVPLLMADRVRGVVAAVHAGWRGTAVGVAVAGVAAMGRQFGSRPSDLVAAIGPSIAACCYEVGSELVDAFAAAGHERHLIDRWFLSTPPPRGTRTRSGLRLDLSLANRDQLVGAGVPQEQIFASGLCSAMHLDVFTSFRAEREKAGRMVGVIRARRQL